MKAPPCQFNEIVGKIKVLSMEVRTDLSRRSLPIGSTNFSDKAHSGWSPRRNAPAG